MKIWPGHLTGYSRLVLGTYSAVTPSLFEVADVYKRQFLTQATHAALCWMRPWKPCDNFNLLLKVRAARPSSETRLSFHEGWGFGQMSGLLVEECNRRKGGMPWGQRVWDDQGTLHSSFSSVASYLLSLSYAHPCSCCHSAPCAKGSLTDNPGGPAEKEPGIWTGRHHNNISRCCGNLTPGNLLSHSLVSIIKANIKNIHFYYLG